MNEVEFRLGLATEFLVNQIKDDGTLHQNPVRQEKNETPYNFLFHLQTVSVLLSLKQSCQSLIEVIERHTFCDDDKSFIVFNEESLTSWNAIASVIYRKQGNCENATRFLNAVIPQIEVKRIHPYFPKSVTPEKNNDVRRTTTSDPGIVLLSLIYDNQAQYIDQAKMVANQISSGQINYSGYDAWALKYMSDKQSFYTIRLGDIHKTMMRISPSAMTSLFAALSQQASIANGSIDVDLMKHQCQFQVDPVNRLGLNEKYDGGFVRKKRYPEIRIDYTIQNMMSMMQYLHGPQMDMVI